MMTATRPDDTDRPAMPLVPGAVLQGAFEALRDPMIVLGASGARGGLRILQANSAAGALLDESPATLAGRSPRRWLTRGSTAALRRALDDSAAKTDRGAAHGAAHGAAPGARPDATPETVLRLRRRDGHVVTADLHLSRHGPTYWVASLRAAPQAQPGAHRSDPAEPARLAATERLAGIGHVVLRLDDGGLDASPNCPAILGRSTLAGLTAQSFPGLFLPEDRRTLATAIQRSLQDGTPCDVTVRRDPRDGARRYIRLRGQLERDDTGRPAALLCVLQDRSDMVRQERQLEQAQRLQAFGQLAGGVAHDFNNLLAVIMGNAELLRDAATDRLTAEDRVLVDEALSAVERGRTLTDSLMGFARVAPLRPEPQRLDSLRDAVAGVLRRTLPANIALQFEAQADGWPVFADSGNLQHVLFNLALNARDAMPEGGTLRITARNHRLDAPLGPLEPGPYVAIAVTDTGTGIAPDDLARVCEPFFTTKPVGQGSGLGLSRVKGFTEQSGGALRIDSAPGEGTRVTLLLPAHGIAAAALDVPDVTLTPSIAPVGARVLLVEDMRDTRRVMRRLLERDGFVVIEAPDCDTALTLYESGEAFDLLMTDLETPGRLQGAALAARLRAARPGLPVVLMSGHAGTAGAGKGNAGHGDAADSVRLVKPISVADLREAIHRALVDAVPRGSEPRSRKPGPDG